MDLLQKVDGNQSRAHEWKSQRSVIDGGNNLKMLNLKALIYGFGKIILLINIEHALNAFAVCLFEHFSQTLC